MDQLPDRILFLALGCLIGGVLGYIVGNIRGMKRQRVEIEIIKKGLGDIDVRVDDKQDRKLTRDAGLVRYPLVLDIALFLVVAITVFSAVQSQLATNKSNDATDRVQHSDVVTCQNANEARRANRDLWDFVIALSLANPQNSSPKSIRYLNDIQTWIDKIYRPHDCNDLTRKYPIPKPPKVISFPKKHHHKHRR